MPPLWEQRADLKREIRELLDQYLQTKTPEETREIALEYAMLLGDCMSVKKLRVWRDLAFPFVDRAPDAPMFAEVAGA